MSWRHLVFPCPLPFAACPSLAPYLAIPLVAPSPSLHGLGAPWLILSPALGSMNGLGAPQWCEGDQIRQGGRPGPPPLPPAAATDPVHQRTIKRRAPRRAPSACRPSRAEPDPRTVSQRPPSPPEPVAPQPAAPPLFFFFLFFFFEETTLSDVVLTCLVLGGDRRGARRSRALRPPAPGIWGPCSRARFPPAGAWPGGVGGAPVGLSVCGKAKL